jgi:hypothetical protein
MRTKALATIATGTAIVLLTASGCGAAHKASSDAHAAASAAKAIQSAAAVAATGGAGGGEGALSGASLRVANMFFSSRTPGGPLDIYDVQLQPNMTTKPTPIISGVPFGSFSDYVHPHLIGELTKAVELEALPAGEDPVAQAADAQSLGGFIDDGSGAQITIVLEAPDDDDLLSGPLAGLTFSTVVEKGDDGQGAKGPAAPPVTGSGGEILASYAPAMESIKGANSYYLMIDSACDPPLNGDPNTKGVPDIFAADGVAPVSGFAVFAASAGSHHVSVAEDDGGIEPTCAGLQKKELGGTDVQLAAGQQVLAYVYGSSKTDLHLALGPIQP